MAVERPLRIRATSCVTTSARSPRDTLPNCGECRRRCLKDGGEVVQPILKRVSLSVQREADERGGGEQRIELRAHKQLRRLERCESIGIARREREVVVVEECLLEVSQLLRPAGRQSRHL